MCRACLFLVFFGFFVCVCVCLCVCVLASVRMCVVSGEAGLVGRPLRLSRRRISAHLGDGLAPLWVSKWSGRSDFRCGHGLVGSGAWRPPGKWPTYSSLRSTHHTPPPRGGDEGQGGSGSGERRERETLSGGWLPADQNRPALEASCQTRQADKLIPMALPSGWLSPHVITAQLGSSPGSR